MVEILPTEIKYGLHEVVSKLSGTKELILQKFLLLKKERQTKKELKMK